MLCRATAIGGCASSSCCPVWRVCVRVWRVVVTIRRSGRSEASVRRRYDRLVGWGRAPRIRSRRVREDGDVHPRRPVRRAESYDALQTARPPRWEVVRSVTRPLAPLLIGEQSDEHDEVEIGSVADCANATESSLRNSADLDVTRSINPDDPGAANDEAVAVRAVRATPLDVWFGTQPPSQQRTQYVDPTPLDVSIGSRAPSQSSLPQPLYAGVTPHDVKFGYDDDEGDANDSAEHAHGDEQR
jgi:hypothetical protein